MTYTDILNKLKKKKKKNAKLHNYELEQEKLFIVNS